MNPSPPEQSSEPRSLTDPEADRQRRVATAMPPFDEPVDMPTENLRGSIVGVPSGEEKLQRENLQLLRATGGAVGR